jgi:hypothetical protein
MIAIVLLSYIVKGNTKDVFQVYEINNCWFKIMHHTNGRKAEGMNHNQQKRKGN